MSSRMTRHQLKSFGEIANRAGDDQLQAPGNLLAPDVHTSAREGEPEMIDGSLMIPSFQINIALAIDIGLSVTQSPTAARNWRCSSGAS